MAWWMLIALLQAAPTPEPTAAPPNATATASKVDEQATHVSILGLSSTSNSGYRPLTSPERWRLFLNGTCCSPGAFGPVIATSIVGQLTSTPQEWGGGAVGYGKRLTSAVGTNVVQGVIQYAGNALLKQDPRFIRSGAGSFGHRMGHAVAFTFLTYNSKAETRLGTANLASFYGSSVVAILWYPPGHHAWSDGVKAANLQMGMNVVFNILQEFWPDIRHRGKHPSP
jgi:hypothetical protein